MEERILSKVLVAATGEEYYIGTTGSYETVVVNVTCDDLVEWSKYTATVYDKTTLETQSVKLDNYGLFTFKIKNGHHYQLLLPTISGYDSPYYMNFTATLANRSVLYKYENNALYEQLNIEAIVVNYEVGVLNEKEVKVVDVDTNTEYTTVFAEGKAVLRIPYGTTYRLFLPDADGLLHDLNYVILTAGVPSRYLLTHYSESLLGYFGIDNEGNQYTIDDIKAMPDTSIITYVGYNDSVLATADRGDGTHGCGVMFKVDNNTVSRQWASANVEFDTTRLPFKSNIDLASKDFASSKNTHNIITIGEELDITTPAASYCDSQVATVGGITRKGYLLAFGVLYRMVQNKTQLNELYLALGKTAPAIHSGSWWSSCQLSATSAVRLYGGGFDYYGKTASCSVLVGFEIYFMREWCSLEEVYDSYIECRKRKRSTKSCAKFEQNEMSNVYQLYLELNTHTYEIGFSDAFCVTRPKIREVFAADFRDRIIHHLLMRKLESLFELVFIEDSYNCRKGKGTDYGVKRAAYFANEYSDGWVLICDLKGFFMSINKKLLWDNLKLFISHNYKGEDIYDVLWLVEKVVLHKPQNKCIKKGDLTLWNKLEKNKSLFTNNQDCGLAIGNLTSQIFANFYLLAFDLYKRDILKIQGGRYVDDDNSFSHNQELLLKALPKYRIFLKEELGIDLHPKKVYLQPVKHGFKFVGSVIKQNRIYAGNRTIGNLYSLVRYYNSLDIVGIKLEYMVQRFNSYLGYLKHRRTYAIRCKIWSMLKPELKQFVYMSEDMCTMKIKILYKLKFKLLKNYGKKRLNKRQLSGDSSGICQKRSSVLST